MKRFPAEFVMVVLGLVAWPAAAAEPTPLKILLVTGGCCHDYDAQQELIKQGLEERAFVAITAVQQGGRTTDTKIPLYENPNWAKGYDLVIHDECFAEVKDRAWTQRILDPHQAGLPGVVIHCAMHCYRDGSDEWFKFCGVTSHGHGSHYAHEVLNRNAKHPIMKEFPAGWANPAGELYNIAKVWPSTTPLASAKNRENGREEVCIWTNLYGSTRVFGTTLGHHNETVGSPEFLDLLTRGCLWACGKLNDVNGSGQASNSPYLKPRIPKRVPVNLAKGKSAKASSEESGKQNFVAKAFDGDRATRWCAGGPTAGEWIQVDLGEPKNITGCKLDWESPGGGYRYVLELSSDGETWKTAIDASQPDAPRKAQHALAAEGVRFARLTYLGSEHGGWASLWEISLFGEEFESVAPASSVVSPDAAMLAEVTVPEEFAATIFAAPPAVNYPTFVAAAPDGTLYVAVDKNGSLDRQPNRGSVVRLKDYNDDGRADESKLFVANVDSPRGLVWDHDRLYLMHPPHLSAFIDRDGDGVSDEQQVLVKNIAFSFKDRPADHTSNGVTLGIDGWLYLAIGDFGFMEAEGADGRKLSFRGGGVVRVRPDGTNLELYSRGTRNILEVSVDPLLNGYSRDNTNDGGGWDIRLHHYTGLEHHGYPTLYMNFRDEVIEPLADYGGGSGCGGLFLDEPGFPDAYRNVLLTADWGHGMIYKHRMSPRGATFSPDQSPFIKIPRATDLDVDAHGRIYAASWRGASFTYVGEDVGFITQVVAKENSARKPLPDFATAPASTLVQELKSPSHRRRLEAQRALIRRGIDDVTAEAVDAIARTSANGLPSRVAAVFLLKQALGSASHARLAKLAADESIRPWVIRALGDRAEQSTEMPWATLSAGLNDSTPRTRLESLVALARLDRVEAAGSMVPLVADADPIVSHTAISAISKLRAAEAAWTTWDSAASSDALRTGALRVLQSMHESSVVEAAAQRLKPDLSTARRRELITLLCRLYHVEGKWTGASWGTRPDTTGPVYQPETWESSLRIGEILRSELAAAKDDVLRTLAVELARNRIDLDDGSRRIFEQAATDPSLWPAAAKLANRTKVISEAGWTLLAKIAESSDAAPEVRFAAIHVLSRANDPVRMGALWSSAIDLNLRSPKSVEAQQARELVLKPNWLARRVDALANSLRGDAEPARWAAAGLLIVAGQTSGDLEPRAAAEAAVLSAWGQPNGRIALIRGAELANHRASEERIRQALADPDAGVATAAKELASRWQIEAVPKPRGRVLKSMSPEEAIAEATKPGGDVGRGQAIFERLQCAKCHSVRAGEPIRGPHLPSVARTYKRNQLAEAILLPSKTLAQGFVTTVFVLENGKSHTGFVVNEAADEVVIRDSEAREIRIPTAEIEERSKLSVSVMPDGLVKEIGLEDLAALVSYLEALGKQQ